jgi:hypothetical protein
MPHIATPAFFTGFDCRSCGGQIPVFTGAPGEVMAADAMIHIMCPHCGHSGQYAAGDAYRFHGSSGARAIKDAPARLA